MKISERKQNKMIVPEFGLANYRSFGPEIQRIGPFSKINLFIGSNNSGKSNILRFIAKRLAFCVSAIDQNSSVEFSTLDIHGRENDEGVIIELPVYLNDQSVNEKWKTQLTRADGFGILLREVIRDPNMHILWHQFKLTRDPKKNEKRFIKTTDGREEWERHWAQTYNGLLGSDLNGATQLSIELMNTDYKLCLPQDLLEKKYSRGIPLIPAIRQINTQAGSSETHLNGSGLISKINKWINHEGHDYQAKKIGNKLNHFVQTVSGYPTAQIRVVGDQQKIEISIDGESFPLDEMATGLHELVLLAAYCTDQKDTVICLEEPESHLHPTWQRALLNYLETDTTNQYFIATHSAHFIDMPNSAVFHVTNRQGRSYVQSLQEDTDTIQAIRALGYKASDLLQANYILWVEGPSDRNYILHWLRIEAPQLLEGIHFTIMFYSGSVLKHLSTHQIDNTDEGRWVPEPVLLRRLNQNMGLVMDSDRDSEAEPDGKIWATKQKVKSELEAINDFVWLTKGRTIENYLNTEDLAEAVTRINPAYHLVKAENCYAPAFCFKNSSGNTTYQKVELSQQYVVVQQEKYKLYDDNYIIEVGQEEAVQQLKPRMSVLDLEDKIKQLIKHIARANNLTISSR